MGNIVVSFPKGAPLIEIEDASLADLPGPAQKSILTWLDVSPLTPTTQLSRIFSYPELLNEHAVIVRTDTGRHVDILFAGERVRPAQIGLIDPLLKRFKGGAAKAYLVRGYGGGRSTVVVLPVSTLPSAAMLIFG